CYCANLLLPARPDNGVTRSIRTLRVTGGRSIFKDRVSGRGTVSEIWERMYFAVVNDGGTVVSCRPGHDTRTIHIRCGIHLGGKWVHLICLQIPDQVEVVVGRAAGVAKHVLSGDDRGLRIIVIANDRKRLARTVAVPQIRLGRLRSSWRSAPIAPDGPGISDIAGNAFLVHRKSLHMLQARTGPAHRYMLDRPVIPDHFPAYRR